MQGECRQRLLFVTQKIHRHLLLTFTGAFLSQGGASLYGGERGTGDEVRQRAHTSVCVLSARRAVCGLDITFGFEALFVRPEVNAVYSRGVSVNIDLLSLFCMKLPVTD